MRLSTIGAVVGQFFGAPALGYALGSRFEPGGAFVTGGVLTDRQKADLQHSFAEVYGTVSTGRPLILTAAPRKNVCCTQCGGTLERLLSVCPWCKTGVLT
jgi:hypothetical protein